MHPLFAKAASLAERIIAEPMLTADVSRLILPGVYRRLRPLRILL